MATFWERNRQKSKWAFLLLLLRWRKGTPALLLLLLVVLGGRESSRLLTPERLQGIEQYPGGHFVARGMGGLSAILGGGDASGDGGSASADAGRGRAGGLLAGFQSAQDGPGSAMARFFAEGGGASGGMGIAGGDQAGQPRGDSMGMVRGNPKDETGGANLAAKISSGGGQTVHGVMTPAEAKEKGTGVFVEPGDHTGENAGEAAAGTSTGSTAPYVTANFFNAKGHAANSALVSWSSQSPASRVGASERDYKMNCSNSNNCALQQVVAARNTGIMSTQSNTASEYRSTTMGTVYDHTDNRGRISGGSYTGGVPGIVSAPKIDGTSMPMVPNSGTSLSGRDVSGTINWDNSASDGGQLEKCSQEIQTCHEQAGIWTDAATQDAQTLENSMPAYLSMLATECVAMCPEPTGSCVSCMATLAQMQSRLCKQLQADLAGLFAAKVNCVTADCSTDFCASDPTNQLCQGTEMGGNNGKIQTIKACMTAPDGVTQVCTNADGSFTAVRGNMAGGGSQSFQSAKAGSAFQICAALTDSAGGLKINASDPTLKPYNCLLYMNTIIPITNISFPSEVLWGPCCQTAGDQSTSCNKYAGSP